MRNVMDTRFDMGRLMITNKIRGFATYLLRRRDKHAENVRVQSMSAGLLVSVDNIK